MEKTDHAAIGKCSIKLSLVATVVPVDNRDYEISMISGYTFRVSEKEALQLKENLMRTNSREYRKQVETQRVIDEVLFKCKGVGS